MNIFGEGFPDEILNQIKYRQKVYGSGHKNTRTTEQIAYLNQKTSWVKLISGVDIDDASIINSPTIKNLGLKDEALAKKFILFGGTAWNGNSDRSGISPNNANINDGYAYGIGGNDFGIRPMMGITSAKIKHLNLGSIRQAEVNIKAFNKVQFDIIDALYMRIGFTVLLEWGHTAIINNAGGFDFNPYLSYANTFLSSPGTYDEWLITIFNARLASGGNYDAMLATVSNFTWSFNPDGSYDITVKLISVGDVIESLKINVLTDSPSVVDVGTIEEPPLENIFSEDIAGDIINAYAYTSTISNFLYMCKTLNDSLGVQEAGSDIKTLSLAPSGSTAITSAINADNTFIKFDPIKIATDFDDHDVVQLVFNDLGGNSFFNNLNVDDYRYYIRLGTFLKFLESYVIPDLFDKNGTRYSFLNIDYDKYTNIINVNPYQVSVDPRVCHVNRLLQLGPSYQLQFGVSNSPSSFINSTVTNAVNKTGIFYGNIMNIYVEMTFILKTLEQLKDDKGDLSLFDFLKGILNGLNAGLGGINNFDVFIDETNNTIKIYDKNPLNYTDKVIDTLNSNFSSRVQKHNNSKNINPSSDSNLIPFGYNGSNAGFIREFSLKTEISSELSTMISVGATARGSVVGENDTALSRLNLGYVDRLKEAVSNSPNPPSSVYDTTDLNKRKAELARIFDSYFEFARKLSNTLNPPTKSIIEADDEDIDNFRGILKSLTEKSIEVDSANRAATGANIRPNYQGVGFLPFNLSLKLDGISGIKIAQQFSMNTDFLPSNYPKNMKFLVKSLSHEITNNQWTTNLETFMVPKLD